LLTEKELKLLAASPWVTIGAHTVSHSRLAMLSEQDQRTEIFESKQYLEQLLGKVITVFSYPFGKKSDYDMTSVRLCREAGFLKAAGAFPGEAHRRSDPFQIPRHFVYNWDASALATYLKGRWIG
jgi:peptidoglycan/xylan/chitin deacetylase (PgdA/CDA1 family)